MKEALHILKKDLRRHCPEIVIALVLLGYYARVAPFGPGYVSGDRYFPMLSVALQMIRPGVVLFWIFLTIRVVQGESLVGDRQWWVTKPYEWWKLLLAKELFLVLVISLPLFGAQLFLLHHAGFPIFPHIGGVLNMQLGLAMALFLPSLALGCLTKNLAHSLLFLVIVIITVTSLAWLFSLVPSSAMSSAADGSETLEFLLLFAAIVAAIGWQYARRKTWMSRGILSSGVAALTLIGVATPYATFVERKYPLVESNQAPAQIAARPVPRSKEQTSNSAGVQAWDLRSAPRFIYLSIPLKISGVAPKTVVVLQGLKAAIETAQGVRIDPGWSAAWTDMWAGDGEQLDVTYQMKRQDFEKVKTEPATLHLEVALTEYQGTEEKDLVLQKGEFSVPELGICSLSAGIFAQFSCRRPLRAPGLMATFDPAMSVQVPAEDADQKPEDRVTHAWLPPSSSDGPEPGLSPVAEYSINFERRRWFSYQTPSGSKFRRVYLYPGAVVKIAKPAEKRRARVKVEMTDVRLLDLTNYDRWN
jgi:hypothetical protein